MHTYTLRALTHTNANTHSETVYAQFGTSQMYYTIDGVSIS